jgi:hypothetical protein
VDELELPPLDVEFCAARAWALSINACAAEVVEVRDDVPDVVDEEAVLDVPDFVVVVVALVEAAGVVLVVVPVDAVLVVPTAVAVDVKLEGTADSQSTVTLAPSTFALLDFDTADLTFDDEPDDGDTASKRVYSGK